MNDTPRIKGLLLLLLVVGGGWFLYQRSNSTSGSGGNLPLSIPILNPGTPAQAPPASTENSPAPVSEPLLARDAFHIPTTLSEKLRQKEADYLRQQLQQQQIETAAQKPGPATPPPAISDLKLQGLFWSNHGNQAIINRKMVSEGAEFAGVKIKKILKDRVVVEAQGQESELILQTRDDKTDENGTPYRPL